MTAEQTLRDKLAQLKQEHRSLDLEILNIEQAGDRLVLQRLKRQKLQLKDQIAQLEDQLFPDIIA